MPLWLAIVKPCLLVHKDLTGRSVDLIVYIVVLFSGPTLFFTLLNFVCVGGLGVCVCMVYVCVSDYGRSITMSCAKLFCILFCFIVIQKSLKNGFCKLCTLLSSSCCCCWWWCCCCLITERSEGVQLYGVVKRQRWARLLRIYFIFPFMSMHIGLQNNVKQVCHIKSRVPDQNGVSQAWYIRAWNSSRKWGFSRKWKWEIAEKYFFRGKNRQAYFFSMKI